MKTRVLMSKRAPRPTCKQSYDKGIKPVHNER
jgi:hypothetical protein